MIPHYFFALPFAIRRSLPFYNHVMNELHTSITCSACDINFICLLLQCAFAERNETAFGPISALAGAPHLPLAASAHCLPMTSSATRFDVAFRFQLRLPYESGDGKRNEIQLFLAVRVSGVAASPNRLLCISKTFARDRNGCGFTRCERGSDFGWLSHDDESPEAIPCSRDFHTLALRRRNAAKRASKKCSADAILSFRIGSDYPVQSIFKLIDLIHFCRARLQTSASVANNAARRRMRATGRCNPSVHSPSGYPPGSRPAMEIKQTRKSSHVQPFPLFHIHYYHLVIPERNFRLPECGMIGRGIKIVRRQIH